MYYFLLLISVPAPFSPRYGRYILNDSYDRLFMATVSVCSFCVRVRRKAVICSFHKNRFICVFACVEATLLTAGILLFFLATVFSYLQFPPSGHFLAYTLSIDFPSSCFPFHPSRVTVASNPIHLSSHASPSLLPSHPSLWLSLFGLLACRVTKLFFFFVHLLSLVFVFNKVIFTTRTPHRASPWRLLSGAPSFLARAREAASLSSFSLCLIPCC